MATNLPKDGRRKGTVKKRVQAYNPRNKRWTEIDTTTHKFMNQMAKKFKPFKGVRKSG